MLKNYRSNLRGGTKYINSVVKTLSILHPMFIDYVSISRQLFNCVLFFFIVSDWLHYDKVNLYAHSLLTAIRSQESAVSVIIPVIQKPHMAPGGM